MLLLLLLLCHPTNNIHEHELCLLLAGISFWNWTHFCQNWGFPVNLKLQNIAYGFSRHFFLIKWNFNLPLAKFYHEKNLIFMNFHFQITNNDFWPYATKKALLNTPFLFFMLPRQYIYKEKKQNGNLRLDLNYHTSCCFCTQLWTAKYVLLYEKKMRRHMFMYIMFKELTECSDGIQKGLGLSTES